MSGVTIVSLDASGERETAAYTSIGRLARKLETEPLRAIASGHQLRAEPTVVHLRVDQRATLRRAREAGRSGNPFEQVLGTMLRRVRPDRVTPVVTFDDREIDTIVDKWSAQVDRGVSEGGLRFSGTVVVEVAPSGGTGIDRDEVRTKLAAQLRDGDRAPLDLSYGPIAARTTKADVAVVAREARAILSHNLQIRSSGHTFVVTPKQIASALTTHVTGDQIDLPSTNPGSSGAAPAARTDRRGRGRRALQRDRRQPRRRRSVARRSGARSRRCGEGHSGQPRPRSTSRWPGAIRFTTPRGRSGSASPNRCRSSQRTTCPARRG